MKSVFCSWFLCVLQMTTTLWIEFKRPHPPVSLGMAVCLSDCPFNSQSSSPSLSIWLSITVCCCCCVVLPLDIISQPVSQSVCLSAGRSFSLPLSLVLHWILCLPVNPNWNATNALENSSNANDLFALVASTTRLLLLLLPFSLPPHTPPPISIAHGLCCIYQIYTDPHQCNTRNINCAPHFVVEHWTRLIIICSVSPILWRSTNSLQFQFQLQKQLTRPEGTAVQCMALSLVPSLTAHHGAWLQFQSIHARLVIILHTQQQNRTGERETVCNSCN